RSSRAREHGEDAPRLLDGDRRYAHGRARRGAASPRRRHQGGEVAPNGARPEEGHVAARPRFRHGRHRACRLGPARALAMARFVPAPRPLAFLPLTHATTGSAVAALDRATDARLAVGSGRVAPAWISFR